IDPNVVDKFGIPVLRFHWKWTDHEYNQVKHMHETFRALLTEMGAEIFSPMPTKEQGYNIALGGQIIHELGCTPMGDDANKWVLNRNCQAHDCKNLFVADGGPFVSQADKNPTWTIMALSWRTSEYRAAQGGGTMSDVNRRDAIKAFAVVSAASLVDVSAPQMERALRGLDALSAGADPLQAYTPKFFNAHEWRTLRVLVNYIIPRDARSGAATDARVPEFI